MQDRALLSNVITMVALMFLSHIAISYKQTQMFIANKQKNGSFDSAQAAFPIFINKTCWANMMWLVFS